MPIIELDNVSFIHQITQYGYFAEFFPNCFNSDILAGKIDEIIPLLPKITKKVIKPISSPSIISIYKNDVARRVISLPNPETFLNVVKHMADNWEMLVKTTESTNSLSPIIFIHEYQDGFCEFLNSSNYRDAKRTKSDFAKSSKSRIITSLGCKYQLKLDISNCYNSIYTHSISWAVCEKKLAKKYFRDKSPSSLKMKYEFSDRLDELTRYQKNNETNGIVVGPFTSRIVSEIILARIDCILREKSFLFKRYVDDYRFYFTTEAQAQESVIVIERILNEYNLNINTMKTEITKFPYEIYSNMKVEFEKAYENDGILGAINIASKFYQSGESGAYKYLLKMIQDSIIDTDDFEVIISMLVNILLLDPKHGQYITRFLKSNLLYIDKEKLCKILNDELSRSLSLGLQQESLCFLHMFIELNLEVDGENILSVLKSDNDFAIILGLDLWKNRNRSVVRSSFVAKQINESIIELSNQLKGENFYGSRWLLLYEIKMHGLIDSSTMPVIDQNLFIDILKARMVSFYSCIKD